MSTMPPQPNALPDPSNAPPLAPTWKTRPAGEGWTWIVQGWRLFRAAPVMWIAAIVIILIIALALGFIPILGQIAFQVLSPVFAAGLVLACRSLELGGDFELEQIFGGFRRQFGSLAILGVIFMLGELAIFLVFMMFAGFGILSGILAGHSADAIEAVMAASTSLLLGLLVATALMVPLFAAYWFAPTLVVLNGMRPVEALKASFVGSLRNFIPFLVYGIVMFVLCIIAAIPLGLGMLVWFPLMVTSSYAAYRDIFTEGDMALAER
jgi:uncharacterized membrane protein